MSLFFLIPWIVILYVTSKMKGTLLFYFVLFQFVFVGAGLAVFPALGSAYMEGTFSSFDFSSLSENDYNVASMLVLSGVFSVVFTYALLCQVSFRRKIIYNVCSNTVLESYVRPIFIYIMLLLSVCICIPFIIDNYRGFISIIFASYITDIKNSVSLRYDAVSNYFRILFIYNLLPATTLVSFLLAIRRKRVHLWTIFILFFLMTTICLLLTYQKRPLLVFLGSLALVMPLYIHYKYPIKNNKIKFKYLVVRAKWAIFSLFLLLFFFYFFYTGARFSYSFIDTLKIIFNIVFSRLFGRLSIPAAMYVDFFPNQYDFYGMKNIGLLARIFDMNTFPDSRLVFSYYTTGATEGSVASSVFIDAYGQGGVVIPLFYGVIIGFMILLLEFFLQKSGSEVRKSFFVIACLIFLYYLSQASLFRSLLGYGGVFYFFVWFAGFKNNKYIGVLKGT